MESMLELLRGWRLGEAIRTAIVAIQLFCIDHKLLVGVIFVVFLLSVLVWILLRRAKPPRELVEGGMCVYSRLAHARQ